jgi:hypothetical protein
MLQPNSSLAISQIPLLIRCRKKVELEMKILRNRLKNAANGQLDL